MAGFWVGYACSLVDVHRRLGAFCLHITILSKPYENSVSWNRGKEGEHRARAREPMIESLITTGEGNDGCGSDIRDGKVNGPYQVPIRISLEEAKEDVRFCGWTEGKGII